MVTRVPPGYEALGSHTYYLLYFREGETKGGVVFLLHLWKAFFAFRGVSTVPVLAEPLCAEGCPLVHLWFQIYVDRMLVIF